MLDTKLVSGIFKLDLEKQWTLIKVFLTAESKTNRSLGSVWSKMSTFYMGLVFRKVIPRPYLV